MPLDLLEDIILENLCEDFYIYALARRSQKSADIPPHKNISWIGVDISNEQGIKHVIKDISRNGGADYFLHFAGYFDFHNKNDPEYTNTNIYGTKYILESMSLLKLKRFIFSSSLAILDFSDPARIIDEKSTRRLLFMISKMKDNPYSWHYRNQMSPSFAAIERPYIKIYENMLELKDQIIDNTLKQLMSSKNARQFKSYQNLNTINYIIEYIFRMLEIDVHTGDRSHILDYAQNLAEKRFLENFFSKEVINDITLTANVIIKMLLANETMKAMEQRIYDEIMLTLQMVMDVIEGFYERLSKHIPVSAVSDHKKNEQKVTSHASQM